MDKSTLLGYILCVIVVLWAIMLGGSLLLFYNLPSVVLVFGGTVASTLVCFPLAQIFKVMEVAKNAFFTQLEEPQNKIDLLVRFAERARREGILALENAVEEVNDTFLRSGIQLAVDGVEPQLIKDILQTELSFLEDRHKMGQAVFATLGFYAPAFGMIGTLIGLVQMLATMDDPSKIGPAMAVALLTTFYGALMANGFFLPMVEKLKKRSQEEILLKELTIEGIMSIQSGDNPRIVRQKLLAFLPPHIRKGLEEPPKQ